MKQAHIYIHGTIGSYIDPKGSDVKGVELLDVIAQVKAQGEASHYLVHISSPGGLVDAGNQIYDYLESLKAKAQVDTVTDGDIGSIATKIFLVGQERTIVDGHEFFIHNPWTQTQPGDSNQIALELSALKQTEAELRNFYQSKTQITEQGLKGLMDVETGMTADQAVTLGFATKKAAKSKVKAFAQIRINADKNFKIGDKVQVKEPAPEHLKMLKGKKLDVVEVIPTALALKMPDGMIHKWAIPNEVESIPNQNMSKESLTIGQKIGQLIDMVTGKAEIKALELEAEGGKKISVSSEDPANLVGADALITDEAGNSAPAPDGEHKLADGRILVVSGGKVADVKPAAAAQAPAPTPDPAPQPSALETALAAANAKIAAMETELASMKAVNIDDKINAAIDGLKNSLVSGKTPVKAINTNGQPAPGPKLSPIQQKMVALQQTQN